MGPRPLCPIQPSPAQTAKGGSDRVLLLLAEHTLNDQRRWGQLIFSQLLANEIPFRSVQNKKAAVAL
jgi:hypothetical protein